jgi:hypothetical protein
LNIYYNLILKGGFKVGPSQLLHLPQNFPPKSAPKNPKAIKKENHKRKKTKSENKEEL